MGTCRILHAAGEALLQRVHAWSWWTRMSSAGAISNKGYQQIRVRVHIRLTTQRYARMAGQRAGEKTPACMCRRGGKLAATAGAMPWPPVHGMGI